MGINVLDVGGKADVKGVAGIGADGVSDTNADRLVNNDTGGNTDIDFDSDTVAVFSSDGDANRASDVEAGAVIESDTCTEADSIVLPKLIEILALTSTPTRMLVVILTMILNLFVIVVLKVTLTLIFLLNRTKKPFVPMLLVSVILPVVLHLKLIVITTQVMKQLEIQTMKRLLTPMILVALKLTN